MTKISIISITKDNGPLLRRTIDSVLAQELPHGVSIEHIIVDSGAPGSAEVEYGRSHGSKVVEVPPRGVYDAINAGLQHATGDIVGLVHGADVYNHNKVLAQVADAFADGKTDFLYGDIVFSRATSPEVITRYYSAAGFEPKWLLRGFAPPHPSLFMTRRTQEAVGLYDPSYKIAGDFEMSLRLFIDHRNLRYKYLDDPMVRMTAGGLSARLINRIFRNTYEINRALYSHGYRYRLLHVLTRFLMKNKYKSPRK